MYTFLGLRGTRSFSHYYKQLGTGKDLQFGALRKAYITGMEIFAGGKSEDITTHTNRNVLRHYIVPEIIARAAKGFEVFPKEETVSQQKIIRKAKPQQKIIER